MIDKKIMEKKKRSRGRPPTIDRTRALEIAMRLFWKHGYGGTSLADLTLSIGCTAPSLYALFGSKEALYKESAQCYLNRARDKGVAGAETTAYMRIVQYLKDSADRFSEPDLPLGCMVLTGIQREAAENAGPVEWTRKLRLSALADLTGMVVRAQEEGDLAPAISPETWAKFLFAILQGLSIQALDGASREDLHKIVDLALAAWPRAA